MVMHSADDAAISAFGAIEPLGDAGDRGGAEACFLFNTGIGYLRGEHFGGLEAFCEFVYLVGRKEVAQKAPRFFGSLE